VADTGTAPSRPDLSVVLVHYRAARLAAAALVSVAADLASTDRSAELLIVDNGSDAQERAILEALPARRLDPGENLGFAGGVNLGVAASRGATVVLMNPDVTVLPGCLPALLDALDAGAAIAGPRFYWDCGRRFLLPPAEARGRLDELLAALAVGGGRRAVVARRRWRRHARRHWLATSPIASHALSGALLAISRAAWERVGPFDAGYRLYFEETDWLARAAAAGLAARYVPAAGAVHAHGQSARREPRAAAWFEESARRYRRRHLGRLSTSALERIAARAARRAAGRQAPATSPHGGDPVRRLPGGAVDLAPWMGAGPAWLEVSPLVAGFPAAGERLAAPPPAGWSLPPEVGVRQPGPLVARLVDDDGRELLCFDVAPGEGPPGAPTGVRGAG
jgi:GT2 family glycosyltransferase